MIAWKPKPFIFVHIPKCAGTSMEAALIPLATGYAKIEDMPWEKRDGHWLPGKHEKQHLKLREFAREYPLREYFKFSIVRNPWDRALSQIEFLRQGRTSAHIFCGQNLKENLKIYCNSTLKPGNQDLGACQLDYLLDDSGEFGMDFVGRFESLPSDFRRICAGIGAERPPDFPHLKNARRPQHYSAYYDAESAEWVRQRFARDIEYFGYTFETPVA